MRFQQQESYTALRDVIANDAKSLGGKITTLKLLKLQTYQPQDEFYGIESVTFELKEGDLISLIA